jgi:hypothetical protein
MTDDIEINEFLGFKVFYTSLGRVFFAKIGEIKVKAPNEDRLHDLIKQQLAEQRRFKPLNVIKTDDFLEGRITSRVAGDQHRIVFCWKNSENRITHNEERLDNYGWDREEPKQPRFVLYTPNNKLILADIRKEQEAIESCSNAISALKEKFEKPVTWETLEQAGDKT